MPPQQGDRLPDLVDEDLNFLTHSRTAFLAQAASIGAEHKDGSAACKGRHAIRSALARGFDGLVMRPLRRRFSPVVENRRLYRFPLSRREDASATGRAIALPSSTTVSRAGRQ
jgi:hypothetical protein